MRQRNLRAALFVIAAKARRILRRIIPVAISEFRKDVVGRGRAFDAALALAISYIGLKTASFPKVVDDANGWILFLNAFFYVAVGWAVYSLIRAPITIICDDRSKGKWIKHHRVYNQPNFLALERFENKDGATQRMLLRFDDVEPGAFVYLKFECDPDVSGRVLLFAHGGSHRDDIHIYRPAVANQFTGFYSPQASVGVRISDQRTVALYVMMEPATIPMVLRVFCTRYFIGKSDDRP